MATEIYRWGNGLYVNLAVGETYLFDGKSITLVATQGNACTVDVDGEQQELVVARRSVPVVVNGVRVFLADNRTVADLTTTERNAAIHAALTKDALLCLSDPAKPLLDRDHYTFPVSRRDGFQWTMDANSHMFAYMRPTRAHEGIDINLSEARGMARHPLVAVEDALVLYARQSRDREMEGCIHMQSATDPEVVYTYHHVNRPTITVEEGQQVAKGDVLGYIWGDGRWGHLHFTVDKLQDGPIGYSTYEYLLNAFPQMYELWYGDTALRPVVRSNGWFKFGGFYWTKGNVQYLDAFNEILGYGWDLSAWCPHAKVETPMCDEGARPDQGARVQKAMHTNTKMPAVNPNDHFDFGVLVPNGKYRLRAKVGDSFAPSWQRVILGGEDAGVFELDRDKAWTQEATATVGDGKLTVRLALKDETTIAGIDEFYFYRIK